MSRLPTVSPSRSVSPPPPIVQPDHFYGSNASHAPPSPNSERRTWLSPDDDPLAHRGIPVFKPTMEEFRDFEEYMKRVECWGMRSGIVKVIPPKEWTESLPSIIPQLRDIQINRPIEQHMIGCGGLFRQENLEKRKFMSVREWVELCKTEDFRAPGVNEVGKRRRRGNVGAPVARSRRMKKKNEAGSDVITAKDEPTDMVQLHPLDEPSTSNSTAITHIGSATTATSPDEQNCQPVPSGPTYSADEKPKTRGRRNQTKEQREANHARDVAFVDNFDSHKDWLPPDTVPSDYTVEFCQELEREYWRNLGLAKPAWYGADSQGSLFTDETTSWNVAHLPSTLSRLLPASDKGLPGVNTPYLYFGMWRATFAWHVEDMDLFSINYIHFGAPKFWYAIPQGRSCALEQTMRSYFPQETSACPQFLRHKSFLASPSHLANNSCRPNFLVQHAGEFVITYPRGYHAGLNLGLNCAESVNFALDSWIEIGRKAQVCKCVEDSVVIDVDQLLKDRALELEEAEAATIPTPPTPTKNPAQPKRIKLKASPIKNPASSSSISANVNSKPPKHPANGTKISVTLKLPPRPTEPEVFPCCLCVSQSHEGLLRVYDPPIGRKDAVEAAGSPSVWMAHEKCSKIVPETWVDEIDNGRNGMREKMVFGVDGIVKDRWNLKCSSCTRSKPKAHGAPVQCTKGKCPKAFHVSCARDNSTVLFEVMKEVEKEVILTDPTAAGVQADLVGGVTTERNDEVLKVIKKLEVQILCTQHNPAVAAEKRASKQEKIKRELMALPSMSRIKIRVSAGVFEVSLVRVVEETGSVEVLWDRGLKKEFKWGSVIFGSTDGPVHQKPSEPAPEPLADIININHAHSSNTEHNDVTTFDFVFCALLPATARYSYPFSGYYANVPMNGTTQYTAYGFNQQYRGGQLQWQQPYQGPRQGTAAASTQLATASNGQGFESSSRQSTSSASQSVQAEANSTAGTSAPAAQTLSSIIPLSETDVGAVPVPIKSVVSLSNDSTPTVSIPEQPSANNDSLVAPLTIADDSQQPFTLTTEMEQAIIRNLQALSSMPEVQLTELLQNNPQLKTVFAAMQSRPAGSA
ncbi:DNA damage-responsive transcriptional repressor RPH1 [Leucoagaricus sp. SymC.cos]|nr:DNA damage-responsive transcriptional repressor RPH1 [Leucoagaricus sp. SymC.cos]